MKREDGKCEDGFGHYESPRPPAKLCVKRSFGTDQHKHICGMHKVRSTSATTVRPVAECTEER